MAIAGKVSLRDITSSLSAQKNKLHRIGLREVSKSNLAYANEHRSYEVLEELFYDLLQRSTRNARSSKFRFKNPLYALDSTMIDLCLSMFDWAHYQTRKGAIRLHCMLDLKTDLPVFMVMTDGKKHDITVARSSEFPLSSDSIIVFDRGYTDFKWFKSLF